MKCIFLDPFKQMCMQNYILGANGDCVDNKHCLILFLIMNAKM